MTIAKTAGRYAAAGAAILALTGCTDWAMYDVDVAQGKVPFLSTLRESVRPDPQEYLRLPADGTVPVQSPMGDTPARFTQTQLDSAAATLRNPVSRDARALLRGQEMYNRQCSVCHGTSGAGNGSVVRQARGADGKSYSRFPFAPAINGAPTAGRSDGYLYGVIAVGRGLMPGYGERLTHMDRWAVVEYVRQLQRQAGATPAATAAEVTPRVDGPTPPTVTPPAAQQPDGER